MKLFLFCLTPLLSALPNRSIILARSLYSYYFIPLWPFAFLPLEESKKYEGEQINFSKPLMNINPGGYKSSCQRRKIGKKCHLNALANALAVGTSLFYILVFMHIISALLCRG